MDYSFITAKLLFNIWEEMGDEEYSGDERVKHTYSKGSTDSPKESIISRSKGDLKIRIRFIHGYRVEFNIIHRKMFNLLFFFKFDVAELFDPDNMADEYYLKYDGDEATIHILQSEFRRKECNLKIYKRSTLEEIENYFIAFTMKYA